MSFLHFNKDFPISPTEFQHEMNRLFDRFWHGGINTAPLDGQDWAPPMDVLEEDARFVIRVEVPGLDSKDIELSVTDNALTLKGHKACERREGDERNYLQSERRFGSFLRTVRLPVEVDASAVSATCKKGVLEVALNKKEEDRPKAIRVEVQD